MSDAPFRSGFVAVVGRPNVGKSTLVNRIVGTKVTITSPRPNTTRWQVRGVLTRPDAQVVFVDTPGLHRPRTALGERLNDSAAASMEDVDEVVAVVEATGAVGPGDRMVLAQAVRRLRALVRQAGAVEGSVGAAGAGERPDDGEAEEYQDDDQDDDWPDLPPDLDVSIPTPGVAGDPSVPGEPTLLVVVNKIDRVGSDRVLEQLATVARTVDELVAEAGGTPVPVEYFPVSASTGEGVEALVATVLARLPSGPRYYPDDMVSDTSDAQWVADLVREELLHRVEDELPHSIACRVTEWEWPRIRCEILVERDSQKGIVIGAGGATLKAVGTAVRAQLPEGAFLELFVRVEKRWQQREDALDRLGF